MHPAPRRPRRRASRPGGNAQLAEHPRGTPESVPGARLRGGQRLVEEERLRLGGQRPASASSGAPRRRAPRSARGRRRETEPAPGAPDSRGPPDCGFPGARRRRCPPPRGAGRARTPAAPSRCAAPRWGGRCRPGVEQQRARPGAPLPDAPQRPSSARAGSTFLAPLGRGAAWGPAHRTNAASSRSAPSLDLKTQGEHAGLGESGPSRRSTASATATREEAERLGRAEVRSQRGVRWRAAGSGSGRRDSRRTSAWRRTPQRPRPGERSAAAQPRQREGEGDAKEAGGRAGAQRAGHGEELVVQPAEGGNSGVNEEGEATNSSATTTAAW